MIIILSRKKVFLVSAGVILFLVFFSFFRFQGDTTVSTFSKYSSITVAIDAGHGGEDPGAIGRTTGIEEKELNLDIALRLGNLLEQSGFNVIYTRTEDKLHYGPDANTLLKKRMVDMSRRREILNSEDVDIGISIHMNSFQEERYYGLQVFYPDHSEDSKTLANIIQQNANKIVDTTNMRSAIADLRGIRIFDNPVNPIVVVECGFLSNSMDEKRLVTQEYRELIARAIIKSIEDFIKKTEK